MSKLIPKKPRSIKAFSKAIIPLWPRATWVPEKENSIGEKMRSLKLELSTEPGNLQALTIFKSFNIFQLSSPEEWILWCTDYDKVCVGMSITTGSARNRMVRQMLADEPLKEFKQMLTTVANETIMNNNHALNSVAEIFPSNAYAKQKKNLRQDMWKPNILAIHNQGVKCTASQLPQPNRPTARRQNEIGFH
jgi:hypothetical protein